MNEQQLRRADAWFRAKPGRIAALRGVNAGCTYGTAAVFCGTCAYLALRRDPTVVRLALTCGVPFVALSLLRQKIDAPRPFTVYGLEPLIPKESPGESFPSRHVFSIFVIGTCFCYLQPWVGGVLIALGMILSALRVAAAVHFERDVLVGAAVGILSGIIGFGLI